MCFFHMVNLLCHLILKNCKKKSTRLTWLWKAWQFKSQERVYIFPVTGGRYEMLLSLFCFVKNAFNRTTKIIYLFLTSFLFFDIQLLLMVQFWWNTLRKAWKNYLVSTLFFLILSNLKSNKISHRLVIFRVWF